MEFNRDQPKVPVRREAIEESMIGGSREEIDREIDLDILELDERQRREQEREAFIKREGEREKESQLSAERRYAARWSMAEAAEAEREVRERDFQIQETERVIEDLKRRGVADRIVKQQQDRLDNLNGRLEEDLEKVREYKRRAQAYLDGEVEAPPLPNFNSLS